MHLTAASIQERTELRNGGADQFFDRVRFQPELHHVGVELRHTQEVIHQTRQPRNTSIRRLKEFVSLSLVKGDVPLFEKGTQAPGDHRQRRLEIV
jgi:hypothetical protein